LTLPAPGLPAIAIAVATAATTTATAAATTAAAAATTAATAAAAEATAAAAATTAAAATEATAAATAATLFSLVDTERTTIKRRAVHARDCSCCFLLRSHRHECKATGTARVTISHDMHVSHFAHLGKRRADGFSSRVERQVAYIQSISH
jgi:hypothetical protein